MTTSTLDPTRLLTLRERRRRGVGCRRPEGRGGPCWEECLHCPALSAWRAAGQDPWADTERVGGRRLAELFLAALDRQGRSPAELMAAVVPPHRSGSWRGRLQRLLAGEGSCWLHVRRFALALDLPREEVVQDAAGDQLEAQRLIWAAGQPLGRPAEGRFLDRYGERFTRGAALLPARPHSTLALATDLSWSGHGWLPLSAVWDERPGRSGAEAQPFLLVAPRPEGTAGSLTRTCRELVRRHGLRGFAECGRTPVARVHLPDTPSLVLSAVSASRWQVLTACCDLLGDDHGLKQVEIGRPTPSAVGRTGGFPPGHLGCG